jgi:serine/threonine-protein kinase HipA
MEKNSMKMNVCPGTLAVGFSTYSPLCLRRVFDGKKVNPILPFNIPVNDEKVQERFMENRKRISISGVQEKLSFVLDKNNLRLTQNNEQGTYILKPIPRDVRKVNMVPANEHLTMQIASQVYQIPTAENALIFFQDGTPAYITKRFDVKKDGSKWGKEDFATLAGKSKDNAGTHFKYTYSYEALGLLFQKYVPAWKVEIEKYFQLVVFNYLFSNGDAHLKNFSLLESSTGDYLLSPAYDLLNTRLHVGDTPFALSKGLFEDNFRSVHFRKNHHPSVLDFIEFGRRIGLVDKKIEKLLLPFQQKHSLVEQLVRNSFLGNPEKKGYLIYYNTRMNYFLA